jgi:NAD(P)-dependent dehydrogenase (short-subunit alcohol dehydrogenase family)
VILTSRGYAAHPKDGILFDGLKSSQSDLGTLGNWIRYGQSKLANILYTMELARRYPQITSVSVHPGVVETGLVGNLGLLNKTLVYVTNFGRLKKPEEGCFNQVWAATTEKGKVESGTYYEPIGVKGKRLGKSENGELAGKLWDWTEAELRQFGL